MKKFFEVEIRTLLLIVLFLFAMQFLAFFLIGQGTSGLLIYGFILLLVAITFISGTVTGLYSSLLFIFIIGTVLCYLSLTNSSFTFDSEIFPLPYFLGVGFALIILVLLAGRIHDLIINQGKLNRRLQEEYIQYVAVDVETGFDNKHRMIIEIQSEIKRIERYGGAFTLILLQMDYLDDFTRLYGKKETNHLLVSLAKSMDKTMRSTDRKFRYGIDRFALLLTNTNDDSVEIVFGKLAERIKTHQLLNDKYVTLTFRTGHIVYDQHSSIQDYQSLISQVESEMVSREL